ncbi:MAG: SAP domain-containing protein [Planctomycetes bacterium]|nr:SAP domain-containing protein [Planctomycetota bacterium]
MRRIETGDWVVLASAAPSLHGVGKVIDGQFAAEDDALLGARVEVGARAVWLHPADLVRVGPADEARLCEAALARGLVPVERQARLEAALAAFRAGQTFVRTPGFVDRLWALSSFGDPDAGSPALATFLAEEAGDVLRAEAPAAPGATEPAPAAPPADATEPAPAAPPAEAAAPAPTTPQPSAVALLAPLDRPTLLLIAVGCGVDLGPEAEALTALQVQRAIVASGVGASEVHAALAVRWRRQSADELLALVLEGLNTQALERVSDACRLPPGWLRADRLRAALEEAAPPVSDVLAPLTLNQLRGACRRLHLDPTGDAAALRARIEAFAADL